MPDSAAQGRSLLPDDQTFAASLTRRNRRARIWTLFFRLSLAVAMAALLLLLVNIINDVFGEVAISNIHTEEEVCGGPCSERDSSELATVLGRYEPRRLRVIVRDQLSVVDPAVFTQMAASQALRPDTTFPAGSEMLTINEMTNEQVVALLGANVPQSVMVEYVLADVVGYAILRSWPLFTTLFHYETIESEFRQLVAERNPPNPRLEFRSWLSWHFVTNPQSSYPATAGVRTAILGTIWIMSLTMLIAVPLGIAAAIYLEEYASGRSRLEQLIVTNIRNLAGVPSVIYGLLGLAVFVRALEYFTSGAFIGLTDSNGRTIISASCTLALLILPVIIIASQEAIRAVPQSLRDASYGLGATKWQTTRRVVLPAALPGIMTGIILSLSRAIGESAPLIVVGAASVIWVDPTGIFSKFTVLPIQIFQWTMRPQNEFRHLAAAAIIVLLSMLVVMNSVAIYLRQRLRVRF